MYLYEAKWKLVLDLGEGADAEKSRNWPLDPDGFDALIETKTFTNGADKDAVKELYRKMSVDQLGSIEMLDFTGIATPTIKDMGQLGRCLNLCKALKKCDLNNVGLTDETCEALLSTLTNEAHVEELILAQNSLAVEAARSVAAYVRVSGSLTKLDVRYNSLGEEHYKRWLKGAMAFLWKREGAPVCVCAATSVKQCTIFEVVIALCSVSGGVQCG